MTELVAAYYRQTAPWTQLAATGPGPVSAALADLLADQIRAVCRDVAADEVAMHFTVSTMLDLPFTAGWLEWETIRARTEDLIGTPMGPFVSAYECASWGYCLRHARRVLPAGSYVTISVLDLNVFDLSYWHANPNWGNSGFGVATVLFRLDAERRLECNIGKSINGFGEFCLDLRRVATEDEGTMLIPPFFPHNIAAMYTRLLPEDRRLPNLTDIRGHCFGSDPWVGLVARAGEADFADHRYIATSVALNGYWAIAEIVPRLGGFFAEGPLVADPLETAA
jgi:hypothetical protein